MTSLLRAEAVGVAGRLEPTELSVDAGQMVALIGPNGGGKTSLLRALAGIENRAVRVFIEGEDLLAAPRARRPQLASFLPASRDVVWPITAHDVIALGLLKPDPARVDTLIELLELAHVADRPANALSTGERARVLFARAMAPAPRLLLLDEPLSNLDPYWALRFLEVIRDQVETARCSALIALHDLDQAERFDRILLVHGGRITSDGSARHVLESDEFTQAFNVERRHGRWAIRPSADPQSSR